MSHAGHGRVLVAGASGGIGAATAVAMAAAGAEHVGLLGRDGATLEQVAATIAAGGSGTTTSVLRCDVTDAAQISQATRDAGRVDVLVASAGTNRPQPFLDVDVGTFDALFDLNVRGTFLLAQAVAGQMVRRRRGCLAFVTSQMGHVGAPDRTVYCATKHAVEGLMKALAVELAPSGVRAVSVAPTFVRTAMTAAQLDDPRVGRRLLEQIPLGRVATPENVADALVWVTSPQARMVTGTSIVVDGGWTAR